jgi:hypothetical protein
MHFSVKIMFSSLAILGLLSSLVHGAPFREYPIGDNVEKNQMDIAAVWLPPVKMDHSQGMDNIMKKKVGEVIHLEADIHASVGNENGFGAGEWIPGLSVSYTLQNEQGIAAKGKLFPMVAKDGPHYGAQFLLPFGKYKLIFHFDPPDSGEFGRHTDPVTGVAPWWKSFDVSWDFNFKGAKK